MNDGSHCIKGGGSTAAVNGVRQRQRRLSETALPLGRMPLDLIEDYYPKELDSASFPPPPGPIAKAIARFCQTRLCASDSTPDCLPFGSNTAQFLCAAKLHLLHAITATMQRSQRLQRLQRLQRSQRLQRLQRSQRLQIIKSTTV